MSDLIRELIDMQTAQNKIWANTTPQERAAAAREELRQMAVDEPELRYLFPDDWSEPEPAGEETTDS